MERHVVERGDGCDDPDVACNAKSDFMFKDTTCTYFYEQKERCAGRGFLPIMLGMNKNMFSSSHISSSGTLLVFSIMPLGGAA